MINDNSALPNGAIEIFTKPSFMDHPYFLYDPLKEKRFETYSDIEDGSSKLFIYNG